MERLFTREEDGVELTIFDLSGLTDSAESIAVVEELKHAMGTPQENSLFTLTLAQGSTFNLEVANALLGLVKHNKPYVNAAAVVGLGSTVNRALLDMVSRWSGRKFATFDSEVDAVAWLVRQASESES